MTDYDFTPTISAFVDNEPVDPDQLAAALEDPDARAALVDFVRMRAALRAGDPPLPPSLDRMRPALSPPPIARGSLSAVEGSERSESNGRAPAAGRRLLRWPAVAALLILVFLAGLFAPRPGTRSLDNLGDAPPTPTRVERFTPGVDWHSSN